MMKNAPEIRPVNQYVVASPDPGLPGHGSARRLLPGPCQTQNVGLPKAPKRHIKNGTCKQCPSDGGSPCGREPSVKRRAPFPENIPSCFSAELQGPRKRSKILPGIFDFEPDLGRKLGQAQNIRHVTGPISACFDEDPKLLNCEIAQPRSRSGAWGDPRHVVLRVRLRVPLVVGEGIDDFRIPGRDVRNDSPPIPPKNASKNASGISLPSKKLSVELDRPS
jgi:hypothetical protein